MPAIDNFVNAPISVQLVARSVAAFTLEIADGLRTPKLMEQRTASAAVLARLIGADDAKDYEIAYLVAHLAALDGAVAERAWSIFSRAKSPHIKPVSVRRVYRNGGQHAA